jgi:hypothetical protein
MTQQKIKQPWERQPDESEKAYMAFECYLNLPRGHRSVRKAYIAYQKQLKGQDMPEDVGIPGYFGTWSPEHDWLNRAVEFDSWQAKLIHKQAAIKIAEARLEYLDHLPELVETHLGAAFGLYEEVSATQWKALKDALDRAGLVLPDKLELTGAEGGPLETHETGDRKEHTIVSAEKALKIGALLGSLGVLDVDEDEEDQDDEED